MKPTWTNTAHLSHEGQFCSLKLVNQLFLFPPCFGGFTDQRIILESTGLRYQWETIGIELQFFRSFFGLGDLLFRIIVARMLDCRVVAKGRAVAVDLTVALFLHLRS